MAYLGNESQANFSFVQKQTFNGDDSTTDFQLRDSVGLPQEIQVYVENVRQEPTVAYTVSGKTLSFTEAPPTGTGNIYVVFQQPTRTALVTERSIDGTALQLQFNFDGTSFTTTSANTNIFSDHLNVTANAVFQGTVTLPSSLTLTDASLALANATSTFTVDPGVANTNIYSDHLNVSANTLFSGDVTFTGTGKVQSTKEKITVSPVNANGLINFDVTTQSILYYNANAAANWGVNVRGDASTTLDSLMSTGESLTIVHLVQQGGTGYYTANVNIDSIEVTPLWQGGSAPTSGSANSTDSYSYSIIKTGSSTFTVLANVVDFA